MAALFALALFDVSLPAQTPTPPQSSGRYLFIVDTSSAMRPRATAAQTTVNSLLRSGMHAELRHGDTIGVWTYNEQLYAGRLPLQQWTPEGEQLVASNILAFLKTQPYEKKSRLDVVWPALQSVVEESEKLTILLVSDGDERISGTPFDRDINEFFKANSRSQKQKRMPFVIVLRSHRGKFINVTLNLAPWPAEFSPFPPDPKATGASKTKPSPDKTGSRPTPPLIVVGKKPEPASVAPTAPSEPTPMESGALTNVLPAAGVETKSPPAATEAFPTPTALPTEAAPTTPAATVQSDLDVPPVAVPPGEMVVATPGNGRTSPPIASPSVIAPPAPAAANPGPTAVAPPTPAGELKPEPSPPPAPVQVATATQPETIFNRTKLLLTAGVLLGLGVAFFFLKQRRARAVAHVSLITRSMDKDKQ